MSQERRDAVATRQLRSALAAPSEARTFLKATLLSWGRRTALPESEVVVSELVTNAVRYAGGDLEIRLELRDDHLRIEVTDPLRDCLPVLCPEPPREDGGFGLHIVDAIAQDWGCHPTDGHKTVWAELDLTPFTP
jgi:anti-sigma regulatory factor (Ser/Thr protein kinase)